MTAKTRLYSLVAVCTALLFSLGCQQQEAQFAPPPPPEVTVTTPEQREVINYAEFTGTTVAFAEVDVRARVRGFLNKYNFKPSSVVKKGDLLFEIDPSEYQARLDQAKAELGVKKAELKLADATLVRMERAFRDRAVSEVEVIQARAKVAMARASIKAAQASVKSAQIDLGYTTIRAPLTGMISRNLVDSGNLVGSGEATLLTSIVQYDPMYAYFTVGEKELLQVLGEDAEDRRKRDFGEEGQVFMSTAADRDYPYTGRVDYVDNKVDPDTGTIQVRAKFPNKELRLAPGLFIRIRVPISFDPDALLVPDEAVGTDQAGRYLMVVDKDNKAAFRRVQLGVLLDGKRVVTDGLKPDDRVIVKGLQRVRPGVEVNITATQEPKSQS